MAEVEIRNSGSLVELGITPAELRSAADAIEDGRVFELEAFDHMISEDVTIVFSQSTGPEV